MTNMHEFSVNAALAEIDYQERLLRALARRWSGCDAHQTRRCEGETALEARGTGAAMEATNAPLVIGELHRAALEEEISCE